MTAGYKVFRNVCPRNCYNTCSILSYVKDGRLVKVEGDPKQGYTQGRLCAKGYAYTEYVYSPHRLRYPLRQYPRHSGNWQRISWEEALTSIAQKLIGLKQKYGSNLAAAYNKFSGNLGLLHYATEGMFKSMGAHTEPTGNPCLAAGLDALAYDYGQNISPDPERMADSKLIVIWGANPAWTAVHQFRIINEARERGAKLVVIDPLYTPTAAKADLYIQIKPGTDGLLALAVAKMIMEDGQVDAQFISKYVEGWKPFSAYLQEKITIESASAVTGVSSEGMRELAFLYETLKPCASWVGFGLQRHHNGGQNVRAINVLSVITGNIGKPGNGLYYFHSTNLFPLNLLNYPLPFQGKERMRKVDINRFASEVLALRDPPVKFLWVASRNPLSQDQGFKDWIGLLRQLEMVVTVDLYMTKMGEMSDIVLPAASFFEDFDLNVSYWHYWLGLNEKTISPFVEAKSDLDIARALTRKLNELAPGFSNFPAERTALEWIEQEFTPEVLERFGLSRWEDLHQGPAKLNIDLLNPESGFLTESKKIEIYSKTAKENYLPAISKFKPSEKSSFPFLLLTPQRANRLHSQYAELSWLKAGEGDDILKLNPGDAEERNIREGDSVLVYNKSGEIRKKAVLAKDVPRGIVVVYQGGMDPANSLVEGLFTDMGQRQSGSNGLAYYDASVEIKRI